MTSAAALLIAALIGAAATGISTGVNASEADKSRKALKKAQEEQKKELELQERRTALLRALNTKKLDATSWLDKPVHQRIVEDPDYSVGNSIAGYGNAAAGMLGGYGNYLDSKLQQQQQKPQQQMDPYAGSVRRYDYPQQTGYNYNTGRYNPYA